jgi:hypothetical protein
MQKHSHASAWAIMTLKSAIQDGFIVNKNFEIDFRGTADLSLWGCVHLSGINSDKISACLQLHETLVTACEWHHSLKVAIHESRHVSQYYRYGFGAHDDYETAKGAFENLESPVDWSPFEIDARVFQNVAYYFANAIVSSSSMNRLKAIALVNHAAISFLGGKFGNADFHREPERSVTRLYASIMIAKSSLKSCTDSIDRAAERSQGFRMLSKIWSSFCKFNYTYAEYFFAYNLLGEKDTAFISLKYGADLLELVKKATPGTIVLQSGFWEFLGYLFSDSCFNRGLHPEDQAKWHVLACVSSHNAFRLSRSTRLLKYCAASLKDASKLLNCSEAAKHAEFIRGLYIDSELACSVQHLECCVPHTIGKFLAPLFCPSSCVTRFMESLHTEAWEFPSLEAEPTFSARMAADCIANDNNLGLVGNSRDILAGVLRFYQRSKERNVAILVTDLILRISKDGFTATYRSSPQQVWITAWAWIRWNCEHSSSCLKNGFQCSLLGWNTMAFEPKVSYSDAHTIGQQIFGSIVSTGVRAFGSNLSFKAVLLELPSEWLLRFRAMDIARLASLAREPIVRVVADSKACIELILAKFGVADDFFSSRDWLSSRVSDVNFDAQWTAIIEDAALEHEAALCILHWQACLNENALATKAD